MVTKEIKVLCFYCGSDNIIKHGIDNNSKQKFKCHNCGRYSRKNPQHEKYSQEKKT
jgi:transposase-like protein